MLTFLVAMAGAVMGAASLLLHALGKKYPKAETLAEDVDDARKLLP
jgi:hypothetical protein